MINETEPATETVNDPNDYKNLFEALSIVNKITSGAERLDALKTGALLAVAGGCLGTSVLAGGLFWILTFICLPLVIFRLYLFIETRHERRAIRWIKVLDLVRLKKEWIKQTKTLTLKEKERYNEMLDTFLIQSHPTFNKHQKKLKISDD